jgi:hypothetical protein
MSYTLERKLTKSEYRKLRRVLLCECSELNVENYIDCLLNNGEVTIPIWDGCPRKFRLEYGYPYDILKRNLSHSYLNFNYPFELNNNISKEDYIKFFGNEQCFYIISSGKYVIQLHPYCEVLERVDEYCNKTIIRNKYYGKIFNFIKYTNKKYNKEINDKFVQ